MDRWEQRDELARARASHPTVADGSSVHEQAVEQPAAEQPDTVQSAAEQPDDGGEVIDLPRPALRVAVVDDDLSIRQIVRLVCDRDPSVECVLAAGGPSSALRELPAAAPDVVLLDVTLGATDGATLVSAIEECCPDAMIMLFSSVMPADGERLAVDSGAFGFYEKWTLGTSLPARLHADHDRFLASRDSR